MHAVLRQCHTSNDKNPAAERQQIANTVGLTFYELYIFYGVSPVLPRVMR